MINILGLLKRLEWGGSQPTYDGNEPACPDCGASEDTGEHQADCLLAMAIGQLEAEGNAIRQGAYRVLAGMGLA